MSNKEYNAREAAIALLEKIKAKAQDHTAKSQTKAEEPLEKAAPQNQTAAQAQDIKVPQQDAPKANEKMISNKELKLKKFMDFRKEKLLSKAEKSKHDKCVDEVKEQSPKVDNPHAVCVAAGVKPEKWGK